MGGISGMAMTMGASRRSDRVRAGPVHDLDDESWFEDGVHINSLGHKKVFELLLPHLSIPPLE